MKYKDLLESTVFEPTIFPQRQKSNVVKKFEFPELDRNKAKLSNKFIKDPDSIKSKLSSIDFENFPNRAWNSLTTEQKVSILRSIVKK